MTCIVGLIEKDKVWIGADSCSSDGSAYRNYVSQPKVFKVGPFLIGCTSSFRMMQILRFSFQPPEINKDIYEYMCTCFVDNLRELFKDKGFGGLDDDGERAGVFMVGYENRLFTIQMDYNVEELLNGYSSCGCGFPYALGALHACKDEEPSEKIKAALDAASHFSPSVGGPYVIKNTKHE